MKYFAKVLNKIEYSPRELKGIKVAVWNGLKIGVFKVENDIEEQIGEYERNYPSLFSTFFHFQKDGRDFALYSPSYTATRIMELPSCKDLGGEEPNGLGFCPTDYFVPTYIERETIAESKDLMGENQRTVKKWRVNNPGEEDLSESTSRQTFTHPVNKVIYEKILTYRSSTPLLYCPFGFVAGCIWGDDSTYKIQYLDLSEAEKGVVKRDERFGYIALPENQTLKDAIDMSDYRWDIDDETENTIRINIMKRFDLSTGEPLD